MHARRCALYCALRPDPAPRAGNPPLTCLRSAATWRANGEAWACTTHCGFPELDNCLGGMLRSWFFWTCRPVVLSSAMAADGPWRPHACVAALLAQAPQAWLAGRVVGLNRVARLLCLAPLTPCGWHSSLSPPQLLSRPCLARSPPKGPLPHMPFPSFSPQFPPVAAPCAALRLPRFPCGGTPWRRAPAYFQKTCELAGHCAKLNNRGFFVCRFLPCCLAHHRLLAALTGF